MKNSLWIVALIAFTRGSLLGGWSAQTGLRYGYMDTGPATRHLISPEISALRTVDENGAHALGLSYTEFRWTDSFHHDWQGPDDIAYSIHAKMRWDALLLSYKYSLPIDRKLSFYFSPRIGGAIAHESGNEAGSGGIAGVIYSRSYSFRTSWRLALEAQVGAAWKIYQHGRVHAGISTTSIQSERLRFIDSLRSFQGVSGVEFSF